MPNRQLKPCPFCGESLNMRAVQITGGFDTVGLHPRNRCILAGKGFTEDEFGAWNARALLVEIGSGQ
jgi:hypothetical protein